MSHLQKRTTVDLPSHYKIPIISGFKTADNEKSTFSSFRQNLLYQIYVDNSYKPNTEDTNNNPSRKHNKRIPAQLSQLVRDFGEFHCDDERDMFKSEWTKWINSPEIANLIQITISPDEKEEMLDKMFFSARYYYRKRVKDNTDSSSTSSNERKKYTHVDKDVLAAIDEHVLSIPSNGTEYSMSPSEAFAEFLAKSSDLEEMKQHKKTYKNRFYFHERRLPGNL